MNIRPAFLYAVIAALLVAIWTQDKLIRAQSEALRYYEAPVTKPNLKQSFTTVTFIRA